MSIAVLISIRPEWAERILKGEKKIEVRKTSPRLEPPFQCYVYESGTGFVVGEFTCTKIERMCKVGFMGSRAEPRYIFPDGFLRDTCLTDAQLEDYLQGRELHGWRIKRAIRYDRQRELSEFRRPCKNDMWCESCGMYSQTRENCGNAALQIIRPPQSWCYVEDGK